MAVPFFFIASGYLLGQKNPVKQIRKIGLLYIVWSVLYLPMDIMDKMKNGMSFFKWIILYIRGFLLVGEHYNSWHLWFLLSLLYALCLVGIIRKNKKSDNCLYLLIPIIAIISIFLDWLDAYAGEMSQIFSVIKSIMGYTIMNGRILQGLYYVPVGICINTKTMGEETNDGNKYQIFTVTLVLFLLRYVWIKSNVVSELLLIPLSICFFYLLIVVGEKATNAVSARIRRISLIVYLIHMYVWTAFYLLVYGTKTFGLSVFVATTIISVLFAYVWVVFEEKYNLLHWMKS